MRSSLVSSGALWFRLVLLLLAGLLHVGSASAVEPFTISDIRVEGLQRSDAGAVFEALPLRVGDTYNEEKGAAELRALFATGLYKDVRIEIEDKVVVVIVDERAIIANVDFVGLKEFDKEVLLKSLREVGIGEGLPFDKALADRAEQELKSQYLTRSLYGVEVVTTVTPIERNRVNVTSRDGGRSRTSARYASSATGLLESTLRACSTEDGRLVTVHEERPLFTRQAQRSRDAQGLLPEQRLSRVRDRVDPGHDLARQAGHHDHRQHPRRAALHGDVGHARG
jgi:outer membrane protein insertion porin family